jgi:hypothetical protein
MLSVANVNAMLDVIMLSARTEHSLLDVIMLSVIILNVVAPP